MQTTWQKKQKKKKCWLQIKNGIKRSFEKKLNHIANYFFLLPEE